MSEVNKRAQAPPAPDIGIPVKLRKGILQLSARQVQHVTAIKPLAVGKDGIRDRADYDGEGGYWNQN